MSRFAELDARYRHLAERHARGEVDDNAFVEAVNDLRTTDDKGRWWQIEAGSGRWLCWDGKSWQPAEPPRAMRESGRGSPGIPGELAGAAAGQAGAVSLTALPGYLSISWTAMAKQTVAGIPVRLFTAIKAAIVAWFVHTYLMAVTNEGFQDSSWAGRFIASDGYQDQALYSWAVGGGFLWFAWSKLRASGFAAGIRRALGIPQALIPHFRQAQKPNFIALAAGIVAGYYISGYFSDQTQLAVCFWSLTTLGTAFPLLLASPVAGLVSGVTRFLPPAAAAGAGLGSTAWPSVVQVGCLGLAAGLFSQSAWGWGETVSWVIIIGSVFAIITQGGKATPLSPRMSLFIGVGLTALAWHFGHDQAAWAHDGGWSEGVNQNDPLHKKLISWIQSQGATETMKRGIPPAISAGAGAAVVDSNGKTTIYCLQVNTHDLAVTPEQPGELLAAVWKSENGGPTVPATDAGISITSDGSRWLTLSSGGGGWRATCMVGQDAAAAPPAGQTLTPASITVTGSGGGQTCTASVRVTPGGAAEYVLEVT